MEAQAVAIRPGMAFDEYWQRFQEQPFELINGEVNLLSPNEIQHNLISFQIALLIREFLKTTSLGSVFMETPFALTNSANWVKDSLVPDVMFIAAERLTPYQQTPNWYHGPFRIAPDLAIEIVSPNDRPKVVLEKVIAYLNNGVNVVWVIDPKRRTVGIYTDVEQPVIINADQTLSGGDLLPGFEVPVHKLFEY